MAETFLRIKGHNQKNAKPVIWLTHDIDRLKSGRPILHNLKHKNFGLVIKYLCAKIIPDMSPLCNFDKIMALEAKYGFKSTFFIKAQSKKDSDYSYNVKRLKSTLKSIISNGWSIGLHGSYDAAYSQNKIKQEKELLESIIGQKITSYRNHYLRFDYPNTWKYLNDLGFKYDSTWGYAQVFGFKMGIGHSFKPYINGKEQSIIEVPIIIMDGSLFTNWEFNKEGAIKMICYILDICKKNNCFVSINWHNNYFIEPYLSVYEEMLRYIQKNNFDYFVG